jgi:hypothetical protein
VRTNKRERRRADEADCARIRQGRPRLTGTDHATQAAVQGKRPLDARVMAELATDVLRPDRARGDVSPGVQVFNDAGAFCKLLASAIAVDQVLIDAARRHTVGVKEVLVVKGSQTYRAWPRAAAPQSSATLIQTCE